MPFFGNLFKNESRSRKKTNLMVFLRPVVVRDAAAVEALSNDRYDQMRAGQNAQQPPPTPLLPIDKVPVLPATPAPRGKAFPLEPTPFIGR